MEPVSVIVPSFNSAHFLAESVASIVAQRGVEPEVVVVDDGSTDGTEQLVMSPDFPSVVYRRLEKNHGGPSRARNVGVRESTGEFIAFLDADDRLLPDHLATAVHFLAACPDAGFVFCRAIRNRGGQLRLHPDPAEYPQFFRLPKAPVGEKGYLLDREATFCCLFRENFILPSGVVLRRRVLERIGPFDESLTNGDDRDMFFRIARHYPLGFIEQAGIVYREHAGSISARGASLAENRIRVLRKQLDGGVPRAARRHGRHRLARNMAIVGWHHRQSGAFDLSRESYLRSLREWPTFSAVRGLLLSLLRR